MRYSFYSISFGTQTLFFLINKPLTEAECHEAHTRKRVRAPRYLLVVGQRLAVTRQRVGPVLSHAPLLRWHAFHQGCVHPRSRAHRRYIPIIRAVKSTVYPPERRVGGGSITEKKKKKVQQKSLCVTEEPAELLTPLERRLVWAPVPQSRSIHSNGLESKRASGWYFQIKSALKAQVPACFDASSHRHESAPGIHKLILRKKMASF